MEDSVADAVTIMRAAIAGLRVLDEERGKLYADLVFRWVDEAASAILEAAMASGNYEYQSNFARKYVAQGKAEGEAKGRAEGEAKGRAHALLTVLASRGLEVSAELRARIESCSELDVLDRWLGRATTARSAADVVRE